MSKEKARDNERLTDNQREYRIDDEVFADFSKALSDEIQLNHDVLDLLKRKPSNNKQG